LVRDVNYVVVCIPVDDLVVGIDAVVERQYECQ
jgi:hypothetical protein